MLSKEDPKWKTAAHVKFVMLMFTERLDKNTLEVKTFGKYDTK